jgi:cysteine desulfurase/selenocysteine lyase
MKYQIGQALREAFPIFTHQRDLVFLDNAASCQKPAVVLEAMDKLYRTSYANVHRGVYTIAEKVTEMYEGARQTVAKFINANSAAEVIFTKNATSALNTAAFSLARLLTPGDEVLLSELEHHANLVPWQVVTKQYQLKLKYIPINDNGRLALDKVDTVLTPQTKVVALTAMSNVTGTVTELSEIIAKAKKVGALVVVDAAQAMPHIPINVQELGCDLMAFAGHKIFGPSGIGVLWGKLELLNKLPPFEYGGGMIQEVDYDRASYAVPPAKFEAGTPPIAEAIGLAAALKFIEDIGSAVILNYENELTKYGLAQLAKVPGLKIIGPTDEKLRGPIFSFTIDGIHPHDLASVLDSVGVAVRAGHHCAMPLHKRFGVAATTRASCTIYNSEEDVNALVAGIAKARHLLIM